VSFYHRGRLVPKLVIRQIEAAARAAGFEPAADWMEHALQWWEAGRPVRSWEEVARVVAICRACPDRDEGRGCCGLCGCRVAEDGGALRNKARMATAHCDRGHW